VSNRADPHARRLALVLTPPPPVRHHVEIKEVTIQAP